MSNPFPVVLAAGLAVFGVAYVGSQADIGAPSGSPGEQVIYNKSIGAVGDVTEDFRTVKIGDFKVGSGRGNIQVLEKDRVTLSKGLASGDPVKASYSASQPAGGKVSFRVVGKDGNGKVFVEVNGNRIFEEAMVSDFSGEGTTVNVDARYLSLGENTFKVGTTSGGLTGSTRYLVEDLEISVNDRSFHSKEQGFQLYTHEINNFRNVELRYTIPVDASVPSEPLEIEVNNRTVQKETLGNGEYTVELTTENAGLRPGLNTISFETSGEAYYSINNAALEVNYAVTGQGGTHTEEIVLDQGELSAARGLRSNRYLRFDYTNLNNPNNLTVTFNGQETSLRPENGVNQVKISNIRERNVVTLSSDGAFRIENLELVVE